MTTPLPKPPRLRSRSITHTDAESRNHTPANYMAGLLEASGSHCVDGLWQCPAHPADTPSLEILRRRPEDPVPSGLSCLSAGCSTILVLKAFRLSLRHLSQPPDLTPDEWLRFAAIQIDYRPDARLLPPALPAGTPTSRLTAIPTRYAGCRFRSRLEARWAVFFDQLGLPWRYELQGFSLPAGPYLPDFWLPSVRQGCWFEVKGVKPNEHANILAQQLAEATGHDVAVAWGDVPRRVDAWGQDEASAADSRDIEIWFADYGWDCLYGFCVCRECDRLGLEFESRGDRICRHARSGDRGHSGDDPRIQKAYTAARSARFEHGESG